MIEPEKLEERMAALRIQIQMEKDTDFRWGEIEKCRNTRET